ncbi:hypothetical protein G7046_g6963 [Stylonectria norvegica]|nr:hypothetical protein G7046_g6963 [Stylonectria norvegica]
MAGNNNDQVAKNESDNAERFHEGKDGAHLKNDSKDQRSIANRLAAEEKREESGDDEETKALKEDPTLPAKMHGNKPSRGAEIDAEIAAEEAEIIRKKDASK